MVQGRSLVGAANIGTIGSLLAPAVLAAPGMGQQWEAFACFGAGVVIWALVFIVWIWSSIWVYRDARSRNLEAAIWLLLALLVFPIGIIIYLVLRNSLEPKYPAPGYYPYPPPPYPYQQPYGQPYQQPYPQQPPQYSPYERVVTEEVYEYEVPYDTHERRGRDR